ERQGTQYYQDMVTVARAIAAAFKPRKMNYEALGNTVGHLHWHLLPRYEWDPHPKRPIWETSHPPRLPSPEEYADTIAAIRRHLAGADRPRRPREAVIMIVPPPLPAFRERAEHVYGDREAIVDEPNPPGGGLGRITYGQFAAMSRSLA